MDATNHHHTHRASKRKKKNQTPESQFRSDLDLCSKSNDLSSAISLYESANAAGAITIHLNLHHFNSLLYICSNTVADPSTKASAIEFGFRVFDRMLANGVEPNEATVTTVARLAAAKEDGDLAFELVKTMVKYRASPKLRSYGPALFCLCRNGEADKAYEVEAHMASMGLHPEEPELAALLKVSVEKRREEKVYEYLHKLRGTVRCVSESTAEIIESWFGGAVASGVGVKDWEVGKMKEAILRNGGGWHGQGWLGEGKWVVRRVNMDSGGCCCSCWEQLVCVDIDRGETEKFLQSVASLAMEREVYSNFKQFQDWLDEHSDYEAIVDGANVGLYQQNFADGGFSISQLDSVVKELHCRSKKLPLVILHKKRVRALCENASSRVLLQEWMDQGVLYGMPYGSNDDWYWLYAAVKLKCLLVTNDEMRDHIFELLGSGFFLKWKERHQVRYTFVKGSLKLQMPPVYSLIIQESEKGSWHVPLAGEISDESSRAWLCITRLSSGKASNEVCTGEEASDIGQVKSSDRLQNCKPNAVVGESGINVWSDSRQALDCKSMALGGKRKDRSPSPCRSDACAAPFDVCENSGLRK